MTEGVPEQFVGAAAVHRQSLNTKTWRGEQKNDWV